MWAERNAELLNIKSGISLHLVTTEFWGLTLQFSGCKILVYFKFVVF